MTTTPSKMMTVRFLNRKEALVDSLSMLDAQLTRRRDARSEDLEDLTDLIRLLKNGDYELSNHEINFLNNWPQKTVEYLLFRYRFRFHPLRFKLNSFPLHVLVEPTSICNLRCVMCFQIDDSFRREPYMGMMSFDLFRKIVDESVENGLRALTISGRGEPLLHKQIGDMLRYAGGKFFDFKLNTNATMMNEELAYAILESGVTELVLSIDSADPEQYAKIRVKGDFHEVVKNIERLREIKQKQFPQSALHIRVSAVKVIEEQDFESFAAFWRKYADDVSYTNMIDRFDTYHNQPTRIDTPCQRLWHRLYVWWDGAVSPCDYDYKSTLNVGDARDSSIKDIWLGGKMTSLREGHTKGSRRTFAPCDRCSL